MLMVRGVCLFVVFVKLYTSKESLKFEMYSQAPSVVGTYALPIDLLLECFLFDVDDVVMSPAAALLCICPFADPYDL